MHEKTCLIVEDDPSLRLVLCETIGSMAFSITQSANVSEATRALRTGKFDLILLDYLLPDGNSVAVSDLASYACPEACVILLTGSECFPHGENNLLAPGIDWVLRKPVSMPDLAALVDYAMEHARPAARHAIGAQG